MHCLTPGPTVQLTIHHNYIHEYYQYRQVVCNPGIIMLIYYWKENACIMCTLAINIIYCLVQSIISSLIEKLYFLSDISRYLVSWYFYCYCIFFQTEVLCVWIGLKTIHIQMLLYSCSHTYLYNLVNTYAHTHSAKAEIAVDLKSFAMTNKHKIRPSPHLQHSSSHSDCNQQ